MNYQFFLDEVISCDLDDKTFTISGILNDEGSTVIFEFDQCQEDQIDSIRESIESVILLETGVFISVEEERHFGTHGIRVENLFNGETVYVTVDDKELNVCQSSR